MSIIINFGKWGGVYFSHVYSWRLCLGWVAITVMPRDLDEVVTLLLDKVDGRQ